MTNPHDFSFSDAPDLGVYACRHVTEQGHPILHVVHDAMGDWQFLCGGDHSESSRPALLCLEHVVATDPSLEPLASLCCNHSATRDTADAPWTIVDDAEQRVRDNVTRHGWHIMAIPGDDEEPGFAYSIGMEQTLGSPEIIMFGLPIDAMCKVINELGARLRRGDVLVPGERISGLLQGADCILRPIAGEHYRDYFGYARWYYAGAGFRAWQCCWPGKHSGLFPWEDGAAQVVRDRQPDLSSAGPDPGEP